MKHFTVDCSLDNRGKKDHYHGVPKTESGLNLFALVYMYTAFVSFSDCR